MSHRWLKLLYAQPKRMLGRLRQLHSDDRGNLGVLLLLTIWALVLLIALVWNTGEFATRRRALQSAADAAAHAGETWVSRTTNAVAASNMVISENGSAEVILRSVEPTRTTIQSRFDSERARAIQLRQGGTVQSPERNVPDCEYFEELIGSANWKGNGRGDQRLKEFNALVPEVNNAAARVLPLLQAQQAARLKQQIDDSLKQNEAALKTLLSDYIGSGTPSTTGGAGSGAGVGASVGGWIANDVRPRLEDILTTLDEEQKSLDQFQSQTAPAVNGSSPDQLQAARSDIFQYQSRIRDLTPSVVEEQRAALAAFHKCDVTFATPGRPADPDQPAGIQAPIVPASDVAGESHEDSIRQRYPDATLAHFGTASPTVQIDPINVNVDRNVIWHPGTTESAPGGITLAGSDFQGSFHVGGGEFGRVPCAPLSRYFNDRVSRDEQGLRREPQAIDQTRQSLGGRILPVPSPPTVPDLPRQFTTGTPPAPTTTIPIPPTRIPPLPTPNGLTPAETAAITDLNSRTAKFDADVRTYVRDLQRLASDLERMRSNLDTLSQSASQMFADATWLRYVESNRDLVLREIGDAKEFMILSTYALHPIPDWAVDGMRDDVQKRAYQTIYNRNIGPVTNAVRNKLLQWATGVLGNQGGTRQQRGQSQNQARSFTNSVAPGVARDIVSRAADLISREVAAEWVSRPWPYEITPPVNAVPPTAGLSDDDRKHHFTFVAAAASNTDSAARPLLPKAFNPRENSLVAFTQSETFNWMEYNESFGAGDNFDQESLYGHGDEGGSPRPWRLSTTGGWNWQPRLAVADALGEAIEAGPQLRDYLSKGGVTGDDGNAIKTLTVH